MGVPVVARMDKQGRTCLVFEERLIRMTSGPLTTESSVKAGEEFPEVCCTGRTPLEQRMKLRSFAVQYLMHASLAGASQEVIALLRKIHEPTAEMWKRILEMLTD